MVGEKGINLSGGQRARVSLARALYANADIYLLDDPLSAVDATVAKTLFDNCINGFLRSKIRILVTHQVQHVMKADQILVMDSGRVKAKGSWAELASRTDIDLKELVLANGQQQQLMADKRRPSKCVSRLSESSINESLARTNHSAAHFGSSFVSIASSRFNGFEVFIINFAYL